MPGGGCTALADGDPILPPEAALHWLVGSLVCRIRGHKPTLWSRPPDGSPLVFCLRCGEVLERLG